MVVLYEMDERERILKENIAEYSELAEIAFKAKKYNSAVTLFLRRWAPGLISLS